MEDGNQVVELKDQLKRMGFPERLGSLIDHHIRKAIAEFTIPYWIQEQGALTLVELNYQADHDNRNYLDSIDISYRRPIEIAPMEAGNISSTELDEKMGKIFWAFDQFTMAGVEQETEEERKWLAFVSDTLKDLDAFASSSQEAKRMAELLQYKHWTTGYYYQFAREANEANGFKEIYERLRSIRPADDPTISVWSVINELKDQSKKEIQIKHPGKEELASVSTQKHTKKRGQSL